MHRVHRHTTTCLDVARHIQERLDYQLSRSAYRQIKRHIERCPNCTAYLDSLKKTVYLYRHEPDPRLPSRTRKKLYAVLHLQS
jgi:hypothetical protein